eukprot:gnl/MRDRNA2_/MRDRNA2_88848_c0_seq1.p1 gnl/MRDRNA2_/MRDRNA2_88848_c0~~gnl/MRDRNA2_/MRDRNA2_88848_c0_seq1.p1  ORF type:complete len:349 (+),score=63.07 gnl/MRDRNA2_/MRDRNA2_88848_c0_seq1:43-1089(+)
MNRLSTVVFHLEASSTAAMSDEGIEYEKATIGFIGIGTIACAVCRGLMKAGAGPAKVVLCPRNAEKAAALASEHPEKATVLESNQAVVDAADWVFLATPPKKDITQETLSALKFRSGQTILCMVAGVARADLENLVAPATDIVQALPLPPAEFAQSTTVMFPPHARMERCLSNLGRVVCAENRQLAMAIGSMSCVMGDFYAHLRCCHQWLVDKGVDSTTASKAVSSYFSTFHHASAPSEVGFEHLVAEQTPGGVNQQVIEELEKQGRYDAVQTGLETAFQRLCPTATPRQQISTGSNATYSHGLLPFVVPSLSYHCYPPKMTPWEKLQFPKKGGDGVRATMKAIHTKR